MSRPEIGAVIEYLDNGHLMWRAEVIQPPVTSPTTTESSNVMWIRFLRLDDALRFSEFRNVGSITSCAVNPWWRTGSIRYASPLIMLAAVANEATNEEQALAETCNDNRTET